MKPGSPRCTEPFLKTALQLLLIIVLFCCVPSCADKKKVIDGVYRGIYEESSRVQEMKRNQDATHLPAEKPLSYDEYKSEREKTLKGDGPAHVPVAPCWKKVPGPCTATGATPAAAPTGD